MKKRITPFSGKRILVTGARGYVGANVAMHLHQAGHTVVTLDRRTGCDASTDLAGIRVPDLAKLLEAAHPDAVVHCAGAPTGPASRLVTDNVLATSNLVQAMLTLPWQARLVHLGCAAEYGPGRPGESVSESRTPSPVTAHGISKLAATQLVTAADLNAVVLRLFSPAGAGTPVTTELGHHHAGLLKAAATGTTHYEIPAGRHLDVVDIRDVARAVELAATRSAARGIINIGSSQGHPLRDLLTTLAHHAGIQVTVREGNACTASPAPPLANISAARDRLGWRPRCAITSTLSEIAATATANRQTSRAGGIQ